MSKNNGAFDVIQTVKIRKNYHRKYTSSGCNDWKTNIAKLTATIADYHRNQHAFSIDLFFVKIFSF